MIFYVKAIVLQAFLDIEASEQQYQNDRRLYQAVILQAFVDAKSSSFCPILQKYKRDAIKWLLSDNDDFNMVCECAGYDPNIIRDKAKKILLPHKVEEVFEQMFVYGQQNRQKTKYKKLKKFAQKWLLKNKDDFAYFCKMGGLHPTAIREKAHRLFCSKNYQLSLFH